jgi:hypothetical protein
VPISEPTLKWRLKEFIVLVEEESQLRLPGADNEKNRLQQVSAWMPCGRKIRDVGVIVRYHPQDSRKPQLVRHAVDVEATSCLHSHRTGCGVP